MRRLACLVLSALSIAFGAAYLVVQTDTDERLSEIDLFGALVQAGSPALADANPIVVDDLHSMLCRVDPLARYMRASLSIAETLVARVPDMDQPLTNVDAVVGASQHVVVRTLTCNPTSGDAWLRLALLRRFAEGWSSDSADLLVRSRIYAPLEGRIVRRRLDSVRVPSNLPRALTAALQGVIEQDQQALTSVSQAR